jgi:hypothetical protein
MVVVFSSPLFEGWTALALALALLLSVLSKH